MATRTCLICTTATSIEPGRGSPVVRGWSEDVGTFCC